MDADEMESWIPLVKPVIGEAEAEATLRVLRSGRLTNGDETPAFEQEFAARHGADVGVAFANGTVALTAMLLACDIGPGDEVIVPSMTFVSTATAVLHVGATPVFADIDPETYTLDPADVRRSLTRKTRAVVPVHYAGQPAPMDELEAIAREAQIDLLEDAAEAHGAMYRGRNVGSIGRAAMFSFTPSKNITTGEGGLVTTSDMEMADRLRQLRNHGIGPEGIRRRLGYNWRLTEIQAAMGRVQLGRLDGILESKVANASILRDLLADSPHLKFPYQAPDRTHPFMLMSLQSKFRDEIMEGLKRAGVESRIYFPPAHLESIFGSRARHLPVTELVGSRIFSVPFHPHMDSKLVTRIGSTLARLVV